MSAALAVRKMLRARQSALPPVFASLVPPTPVVPAPQVPTVPAPKAPQVPVVHVAPVVPAIPTAVVFATRAVLPVVKTDDFFGDDEYEACGSSREEACDVLLITMMMARMSAHDEQDEAIENNTSDADDDAQDDETPVYNNASPSLRAAVAEAIAYEAAIVSRRAMSYSAFIASQLGSHVVEGTPGTRETPVGTVSGAETVTTAAAPSATEYTAVDFDAVCVVGTQLVPSTPVEDLVFGEPVRPDALTNALFQCLLQSPQYFQPFHTWCFYPQHDLRYYEQNYVQWYESQRAAQRRKAREQQAANVSYGDTSIGGDGGGDGDGGDGVLDGQGGVASEIVLASSVNHPVSESVSERVNERVTESRGERNVETQEGGEEAGSSATTAVVPVSSLPNNNTTLSRESDDTAPTLGCTQHRRESPEHSEGARPGPAHQDHADSDSDFHAQASIRVHARSLIRTRTRTRIPVGWSRERLEREALRAYAENAHLHASMDLFQNEAHLVYQRDRQRFTDAEATVAVLTAQLAQERSTRTAFERQLHTERASRLEIESQLEESQLVSAINRRDLHRERAARFMADHKCALATDYGDQARVDALKALHAVKDILDQVEDSRAAVEAVISDSVALCSGQKKKTKRLGRKSKCQSQSKTPCQVIDKATSTDLVAVVSPSTTTALPATVSTCRIQPSKNCLRTQIVVTNELVSFLQTIARLGEWRVLGHATDGQLTIRIQGTGSEPSVVSSRDIFAALDQMHGRLNASVHQSQAALALVCPSHADMQWLLARQTRLAEIAEHLYMLLSFVKSALLDAEIPCTRQIQDPNASRPAVWKYAVYDKYPSYRYKTMQQQQELPGLLVFSSGSGSAAVPNVAQHVVIAEHVVSRLVMSAFHAKIVAATDRSATGNAHSFAAGASSPRHLRQICSFAVEAEQLIKRCEAATIWYGKPLAVLSVTVNATKKAYSMLFEAVVARTRMHPTATVVQYYLKACDDAKLMAMDTQVYSPQYLVSSPQSQWI